ncbi:MAG: hypothetical protein IJI85_10215 [Clostridia bacterium]|nr:hypothetical protein [Clostridia bacterium]
MNTVEAAETWGMAPRGDTGNPEPAGGTAEELREEIERCQTKIDEGLALLVMVDKLSKHFSARAELFPKGFNDETTYRKAVMLLEAVREPEIAVILRWQQDRDALKRQIGEAGK